MKLFLIKIVKSLLLAYLNFGSRIFGLEFINNFLSRTVLIDKIPAILRRYGAKIGNNPVFRGLFIDNATPDYRNLKLGNDVFVGKNCFFDLADEIVLADSVVLAAGVAIFTHGDVGNRRLSKFLTRSQAKVVIGEGSFIGAGAIVLCGAVIEPMAIVAAGSVVTSGSHLESGYIYGGAPARRLKPISPNLTQAN